MKLDNNGCIYYDQKDLFALLYRGRQNLIQYLPFESDESIRQFESHSQIKINYHSLESVDNYDRDLQSNWFMPDEYKNMDIEGFLVNQCPKQNYQRLIDELKEFKHRDMLNLLRWLKFCVDTCQSNQIVIGVGRGSSVSSYALYLLGVHKIDSVKYKLDFSEFMR